jgi:hypothetical protein
MSDTLDSQQDTSRVNHIGRIVVVEDRVDPTRNIQQKKDGQKSHGRLKIEKEIAVEALIEFVEKE